MQFKDFITYRKQYDRNKTKITKLLRMNIEEWENIEQGKAPLPLYAVKLIKDYIGLNLNLNCVSHQFGEDKPYILRELPEDYRDSMILWLFRNSRCLTLEQLSKVVGVSRSTLSRYETKGNIPQEFKDFMNKKYDNVFTLDCQFKGKDFTKRFKELCWGMNINEILTKFNLTEKQFNSIWEGSNKSLPISFLHSLVEQQIDLNKIIGV